MITFCHLEWVLYTSFQYKIHSSALTWQVYKHENTKILHALWNTKCESVKGKKRRGKAQPTWQQHPTQGTFCKTNRKYNLSKYTLSKLTPTVSWTVSRYSCNKSKASSKKHSWWHSLKVVIKDMFGVIDDCIISLINYAGDLCVWPVFANSQQYTEFSFCSINQQKKKKKVWMLSIKAV